MKLSDLLNVLSNDQLVGIWNLDNKRETMPLYQHYAKVRNLSYKKLRNLLDCDVMQVNVVRDGLLIRVYDRERFHKRWERGYLAEEIAEKINKSTSTKYTV